MNIELIYSVFILACLLLGVFLFNLQSNPKQNNPIPTVITQHNITRHGEVLCLGRFIVKHPAS